MLPTNEEWLELFVLLLMGPGYVLVCASLIGIALWKGAGWSNGVRVMVLAFAVLVGLGPVLKAFSVGSTNRGYQLLVRGIAAAEVVAMLGLAGVLLLRRKK